MVPKPRTIGRNNYKRLAKIMGELCKIQSSNQAKEYPEIGIWTEETHEKICKMIDFYCEKEVA